MRKGGDRERETEREREGERDREREKEREREPIGSAINTRFFSGPGCVDVGSEFYIKFRWLVAGVTTTNCTTC